MKIAHSLIPLGCAAPPFLSEHSYFDVFIYETSLKCLLLEKNQSCMNLQRHFIFCPVLIGNGEMKDIADGCMVMTDVKLTFHCKSLDDKGWVMDFGGKKDKKVFLEDRVIIPY